MRYLNIKKVLSHLKSKNIRLYIAIFFIILIITGFLINGYKNYIIIEKLKVDLLKTQEKIPSEEDKQLIEYKNKIKDLKEQKKAAEIKKLEAEKEILKNLDFEECFKKQIERVINGKESLIDYCENNFQKSMSSVGVPEIKKAIEIEKKVIRNDWNSNDKRQDYINYIYEKAGKDALLTFTGENTKWTIDRPSTQRGFDGNRAYGFCQLYYRYHKPFIDSKNFKDPYKQLDYCIGVYKDGEKRGILNTTFYAYPSRSKWNYLYSFK